MKAKLLAALLATPALAASPGITPLSDAELVAPLSARHFCTASLEGQKLFYSSAASAFVHYQGKRVTLVRVGKGQTATYQATTPAITVTLPAQGPKEVVEANESITPVNLVLKEPGGKSSVVEGLSLACS